ncbi:MAG: response regulator [Proteobacteria bacterium]|nr:response regulator [Pseudomonadota bacterium]
MLSPFEVRPLSPRPKVLLVEDDTAVRRSLLLVLQARGFDVKAYADPVSLLREGATKGAACLIADYLLQRNCDGLDLLGTLRKNRWAGPAILITAHSSAALSEKAFQCGFAAVLAKPFRERELAETVIRLIGRGQVRSPSLR